MRTTTSPWEIAGGFAVAVATACLGFYFSMRVEGDAGTGIVRWAYIFAALIVLKFTFGWGRARGFPARREDGGIAIAHVFRNLVMAGIVGIVLLFVSAPFMMLAFKLAR